MKCKEVLNYVLRPSFIWQNWRKSDADNFGDE